jgi:predicted dienelactone hydrolase
VPYKNFAVKAAIIATILWAQVLACVQAATMAGAVGMAKYDFPVKGETDAVHGFVFYPAQGTTGPTTAVGPYRIQAQWGARLQGAHLPLIVISHGQGGSALGHHDLATFLAARGYIVATLEHPKDNVRDSSGIGTPEVLLGRPRQVSALLDALLEDARWASVIDRDRIGVAGFSMGGYTALVLMGARPNFLQLLDYCRAGQEPDMCALLATKGESRGAKEPAEWYANSLEEALKAAGHLSDARIKAAFVMAPMALVFDDAALKNVTRPVFLHYASADRNLDPKHNASVLIRGLPNLVGRTSIVGSDHWVYLPPCSPELSAAAPQICKDNPGVDRASLHVQVQQDALAFFKSAL